jgi:hypothetical protein
LVIVTFSFNLLLRRALSSWRSSHDEAAAAPPRIGVFAIHFLALAFLDMQPFAKRMAINRSAGRPI